MHESPVGKIVAAVHFITVPCKPNTVHTVQGKPYFCSSSLYCAGNIVYSMF